MPNVTGIVCMSFRIRDVVKEPVAMAAVYLLGFLTRVAFLVLFELC